MNNQITFESLKGAFDNKTPLFKIFGFSPAEMSEMYDISSNLYYQGDSQNAEHFFAQLLFFDCTNKKYAEALAISRKDQGNWLGALTAYEHLLFLDPKNHKARLNIIQCAFEGGCPEIGNDHLTKIEESSPNNIKKQARNLIKNYSNIQ